MAQNFYTSPYGTKINVKGITGKPLQKIQTLANNKYGTQASQLAQQQRLKIKKANQPLAPAAETPAPANPIQPLNTNNLATATPPAPSTANTANALFPSTRMFEPQNYEGSPLYQFQVKQGQDQLAKSLAARGLTNSGEAIRQEVNIPLQAAAQDTDRMTRIASENADRLKAFQDAEALRLERQGNTQWDRQFALAQLMAQQSPWAASVNALNATAKQRNQAAQAQANYLKDMYTRLFPSGGGGGGGGSTAMPIPLPAAPSYTNLMPNEISNNFSQNTDWLTLASNLLSSFTGNKKETKPADKTA